MNKMETVKVDQRKSGVVCDLLIIKDTSLFPFFIGGFSHRKDQRGSLCVCERVKSKGKTNKKKKGEKES